MKTSCIPMLVGILAILISGCGGLSAHRAAYQGSKENVESLLRLGENVDENLSTCAESDVCSGFSLLQCSVRGNNLETAKFLLSKGANMYLSNLYSSDESSCKAAITPGMFPSDTPLEWAGRNLDMLKLFLDLGANVNATRDGYSLLAHNALRNRPESARFLIQHGADVDAALAKLEGCGADCAGAVRLIDRLVPRELKGQASSGGISKDDLSSLVQAAVEGSARAKVAQPKAIVSDIDKPSYRLPERPNYFALVVGIGKYSDIPEAQFAERDAEAVKNHLIAEGFPSRNIVILTGEKAGYKGIEKFVETWLPKNVDENSRVFFYFSGHGAPDAQSGQAYLLPYDGDPAFLENTGYPLKRLYEKLADLKAKEVLVAIDACFSGAGGRSVLAKGARPLVMNVETATVPQKLMVFAAAAGNQITGTLDDQGHGIFTYYFLKGLGGAAKDVTGKVTVNGLYDYLKPKVQDAARRQNRDQAPVLHSQGDRKLIQF